MMSLTFGLFTQVSGSGPLGPLVMEFVGLIISVSYRRLGNSIRCISKSANCQKDILPDCFDPLVHFSQFPLTAVRIVYR